MTSTVQTRNRIAKVQRLAVHAHCLHYGAVTLARLTELAGSALIAAAVWAAHTAIDRKKAA